MSATTRIALKALAISASSLALMHTAPAMAQEQPAPQQAPHRCALGRLQR